MTARHGGAEPHQVLVKRRSRQCEVVLYFSEYATLPANRCPFSLRREVACFDEDFGEAVGEAVEPNANSVV